MERYATDRDFMNAYSEAFHIPDVFDFDYEPWAREFFERVTVYDGKYFTVPDKDLEDKVYEEICERMINAAAQR